MRADLTAILKAVEGIIALEKKIETALAGEKDRRRRERLLKACKERNLEAIRKELFSIE